MLPEEYEVFSVDLPLEHVHTGLAIGNGVLGLSVWGDAGKSISLWGVPPCGITGAEKYGSRSRAISMYARQSRQMTGNAWRNFSRGVISIPV